MGNDIETSIQPTVEICMDLCLLHTSCQAFTYDTFNRFPSVNCWFKTQVANINMAYEGLVSGMRCSLQPILEPPTVPDGEHDGEGKFLGNVLGNYRDQQKTVFGKLWRVGVLRGSAGNSEA